MFYEKNTKYRTFYVFNKKVLKNERNLRRQKVKKILPKSRRGFKKWTKINVQFSKPRVFCRHRVLKTCFRA